MSGYLKTLTVDKGDAVKEGQLLAEIEVPELLADEVQYKAETAVSRTNYERMAEARQKAPDLVVPQTVDDLRGQWEVAQAKLQRTQTLLQYARIVAPFTGVITARFVDPGAFIAAATAGSTPQSAAMVTLMDYSRVRVQVFVPEAEVPFIKNGLPVQVTVEELPGRSFPGTVTRFAHALDETTKTMLTEIEMPNPTASYAPAPTPGCDSRSSASRTRCCVPVQALAVEKAGTFVFTVADGKAKKTPVHTGFNDGVNVEVTDLKPDQPVILVGKQTAHRRPASQRSGGEMRRGIWDLRCPFAVAAAGEQPGMGICAAHQRGVYPIDLPTTLQLAGAQNLDIQIARERLSEAQANRQSALEQFFPWITAGVAYHRGDGVAQAVPAGTIADAHYQSYNPGAALTAQMDLGDAIYKSLAAKQLVKASDHALETQRQDTTLSAAQGYFELAKAGALVEVAREATAHLPRLPATIARGGRGRRCIQR